MIFRTMVLTLSCAALAACSGNGADEDDAAEMDPASEAALNDNLGSDPDLANSAEGNAALSGTGNGAVPRINTSARAIEAARARAAEMVGGTENFRRLAGPQRIQAGGQPTASMMAAAQAVQSPGGSNCFAGVSYTASWAAKLPGTFPVYPRGSTMESAGNDEGACAVRAVTFRTPVGLDEVLSFYNTRALADGYSVEHVEQSGERILSGKKGEAAYTIYGRRLADGVSEIDLVTSTP